jgi:low affinity Fe/Cu permease
MESLPDNHRAPSEIDRHRSWFDELAAKTQEVVSRDTFFLTLVVLTAIWGSSLFLFDTLEHWYLTFVLPSEVVTLFMVALLANHDRRSDQAAHRKMDAMAVALAALIAHSPTPDAERHAKELRAAHGLEDRESTDDAEDDR